jgi:hypothetical protein
MLRGVDAASASRGRLLKELPMQLHHFCQWRRVPVLLVRLEKLVASLGKALIS